jgi:hypothetical protein
MTAFDLDFDKYIQSMYEAYYKESCRTFNMGFLPDYMRMKRIATITGMRTGIKHRVRFRSDVQLPVEMYKEYAASDGVIKIQWKDTIRYYVLPLEGMPREATNFEVAESLIRSPS